LYPICSQEQKTVLPEELCHDRSAAQEAFEKIEPEAPQAGPNEQWETKTLVLSEKFWGMKSYPVVWGLFLKPQGSRH